VDELLRTVGLSPSHRRRYPHEFSGGQRQRLGIARALSVRPRFLVLDEPVSALDLSVQAQILNLLQDLRQRLSLTFLLIAHDLGVVRQVADRVCVLYLGKVVEEGTTDAVLEEPRHPFTAALLAAEGLEGGGRRPERKTPVPGGPRDGCPFRLLCNHPEKDIECEEEAPALRGPERAHRVACWKAERDSMDP
jgi:oligopeptide/dipeptide ABC transporter ATP-binding protein